MQITVLGGGSWGTALAHHLSGLGHQTTLFLRDQALAEHINQHHENHRYLPNLPLAPSLRATTQAQQALASAEICLFTIPCQQMRETLSRLASFIPPRAIPVCANKGIELEHLCCMHELIAQILPEQSAFYAILSGPSFARELIAGKPTAVVLGCAEAGTAKILQKELSSPLFRIYSSPDIKGVELGGALKNIIAIAAGVCDGLQLGGNARAGLITRGLAEISRLGTAMGAQAATFMGLSGLGDLVLTCTGNLSRNRQVGLRLGRGERLDAIQADMHNVAEGIKTTDAACLLGERYQIDLPIATGVQRILKQGAEPAAVVQELMNRALREE